MSYSQSEALQRWLGPRAEVLEVIRSAHADAGQLSGPGLALGVSRPLAHAYVLVLVAEFQGFARDLHDLAVERVVTGAGASPQLVLLMVEGMTSGRQLDRGNATLSAIKEDFGRLGLSPLDPGRLNARWASGDKARLDQLLRLRNALAHGNQRDVSALRNHGVLDTVAWASGGTQVLNRLARSLDRLVWDHLVTVLGSKPWR